MSTRYVERSRAYDVTNRQGSQIHKIVRQQFVEGARHPSLLHSQQLR